MQVRLRVLLGLICMCGVASFLGPLVFSDRARRLPTDEPTLAQDWGVFPLMETYKEYEPMRSELQLCEVFQRPCSVQDYQDSQRITILQYPPFFLPAPNVVSEYKKELIIQSMNSNENFLHGFLSAEQCKSSGDLQCDNLDSDVMLFNRTVDTLGMLMTVKNQLARSNWKQFCDNTRPLLWLQKAFGTKFRPIAATESVTGEGLYIYSIYSHFFQHFLDSSMSKLMQWLDEDLPSNTTVFIEDTDYSREYLCNVPPNKSFACNIDGNTDTFVEKLHIGCVAPRLHPYHWRRFQNFFGVQNIPLQHRHVIIYTQRRIEQLKNKERLVTNEQEVLQILRDHIEKRGMGEELLIYDHRNYTQQESVRLFNSARAVIGPHGGAMYNSFFCPPGTLIIEFHALNKYQVDMQRMIPYHVSNFLQHNYFFVPHNTNRNIRVDLESLSTILNKQLPITL